MIDTFIYLMHAYFYQEWWVEYSDPKANDADVIMRFASKENVELLNSLVKDFEYILENDLAEITFKSNSFDFYPLLNGYKSEKEWFEAAYKLLTTKIK